jgi:hypothetical protein
MKDEIEIWEDPDGIKVNMELHFFNGHMCHFDGKANWGNGKLTAKGNESESKCVVDLYSDGHRVTTKVSDENSVGCQMYCGARGSLNNAYAEKSEPSGK